MALRSTWSGTIQFGMVSVPVKLYSATEDGGVHFSNLHAVCNTAVKMARTCPTCLVPMTEADMVKGYEVARDTFVRVEPQEIEMMKASLRATKAIEVLRFVEAGDLDTRYYEAPYFVGFDPKAAGRPFALLHAGMEKTGLFALARIVMREKEHLAILSPAPRGMMLWTLRWADEVRDSAEAFTAPLSAVTDAEVNLAVQLISQLKGELDLTAFTDGYKAAVLGLVESKQMGNVVEFKKPEEIAAPLDLMAALQASLAATKPQVAPAEAVPAAPAKGRKAKVA